MRRTTELGTLIQGQPRTMRLLRILEGLALPDSWIAGGHIRSTVWDFLQGYRTSARFDDVDVIYFDSLNALPDRDERVEATLRRLCSDVSWSVKNQARMHHRNGDMPYHSSADAVWHWPETSSAVAARSIGGKAVLMAPHGIDDLVNGVVRPTPAINGRMDVYRRRVMTKDWMSRWSRLTIVW